MKNKGIYYFLFLTLLIASVFLFSKVEEENNLKNPQISELAMQPDLLIKTGDRYLHDHKRLAAIKSLDHAIETMRILEKGGDSISRYAIEVAIHDLSVVEDHINADDIDDDFMYEAYADAMNSLAYASLRVSEGYLMEGKEKEADLTLKHAMQHLTNSIKYAKGDQKENELEIISHLESIIENHLQNDLSHIDAVMGEIDSLVQAHVIE